jgi:GT2 family glycosyltransferase
MSLPSVAIVVCTYNNRPIIDACLQSIAAQQYPNTECLLIDDGSTDGTAGHVEASFPWVRVLRSLVNVGPARNRNVAVASSRAELFAFLDSDVELAPDWLEETVSYLSGRPEVGIVAGKLLYASDRSRVNSYGGALSRIGLAWDASDGAEAATCRAPLECLWVISAAMLARADVLRRIEGFDEAFVYGYDDSDLGWRANLTGARCVCIPSAVAYHGARRTSRAVFHYNKNRLRSMLKNMSLAWLARYLPLYAAYSAADIVFRADRGPKLRAWWWNVTHAADTLRRRRRVQRLRRMSDGQLAPLFSARYLPPVPMAKRHLGQPVR